MDRERNLQCCSFSFVWLLIVGKKQENGSMNSNPIFSIVFRRARLLRCKIHFEITSYTTLYFQFRRAKAYEERERKKRIDKIFQW